MNACDYSVSRPAAGDLAKAGIVGAVRYCVDGSGPAGKAITVAEYKALLAAGLQVALVQETGPQPALSGASGGTTDAHSAELTAAAIGYPATAVIYYVAEDPNVLPQSDWPTVVAYFQAVRAVNPDRPIGAYGSQALVVHLQQQGLATYGWCVAPWSTDVTGMHLCQSLDAPPPAFTNMIDIDIVLQDDWGQAPRPAPSPPPAPQGVTMAKPCVFSTPDKNQQVFYVDTNGVMHHYWWDSTGKLGFPNNWSPDEPIGGGWEPNGELVWAKDSMNTYQVWGVTAGGRVAQVYWSGSEWVLQALG